MTSRLVGILLMFGFLFGAGGCAHQHVLPAVTFPVRVIDVDSGAAIAGAKVTAFIRTRAAPVLDIEFAPVLTDVMGNAVMHCPKRNVPTRSLNPSWKGGYDNLPALHIRHPAYHDVTRTDGSQMESELTKTGEVVVTLKKKASGKSAPPKTPAPGAIPQNIQTSYRARG